MKQYTLNNGSSIPSLGLGMWQLEGQAACVAAITAAVSCGCRLIDTAAAYLNERAVGAGVRACGLPREALFLTSKVWVQDAGYEQTKGAIGRTLDRLNMDYLDLYLIHWPYGDYLGSWRAMEEYHAQGVLKNLGVCNCSVEKLETLMAAAAVMPVVNQVECHPLLQQRALHRFMRRHGILLEAWSPLAHAHPALFQSPRIKTLAGHYGKTVAQIVLRWHIQEGHIAIPTSHRPARIRSNFDIWDFTISEADMDVMRTLECGKRVSGESPEDPRTEAAITSYRFEDESE